MQYQKVQLDLVSTGRCHTLPHTNIPYFFLQKYGLIFSYIQIYQKYVLGGDSKRYFSKIFPHSRFYTLGCAKISKSLGILFSLDICCIYMKEDHKYKKKFWGRLPDLATIYRKCPFYTLKTSSKC